MKISIKFNIKLFVGFSVLFIFGMSLSCFAQTRQESLPQNCEINGRVTDEKGKPLDQVSVKILIEFGVIHSTKTDKNGNYKISKLKPGKYYLLATSTGYIEDVLKNVIISNDSNLAFNFNLKKCKNCNHIIKQVNRRIIDPSNPGRKIITKQELREMGY